MDGANELRQLAFMLRLSAEIARKIATLRPDDAAAIGELVCDALRMAAEVEAIAEQRKDG